MITDTGKKIVAKYLIGTAPAFASYIAIGCGAKPRLNINTLSGASSSGNTVTVASTEGLWLGAQVEVISGTGQFVDPTIVTEILSSTQFQIDSNPTIPLSGATIILETPYAKEVLDFEMFRVPITSRGYINDNGTNKIIFTAELPTEERYEISEVGIYSAGTNANAGAYDSKTISAFADTENWQYNDGSTLSNPTYITASLVDALNVITSTADAIQTNANNAAFLDINRSTRYERCRYLNNVVMLRGNTSDIDSTFTIAPGAKFLQISGQSIDFSRNSASDLLKIAFSIISVDGNSSSKPDFARLVVEFSNNDGTQYARMNIEESDVHYNFSTNRYVVAEKRLDELIYTPTFSWKNVGIIKIYVSTETSGSPSADYFIALDAIRLDNIATINPLYGLTGYSIIQNENAETLLKSPNTNNYIEFRMIIGITS